jgi:uncharacterized protein (TIGR02145 family)
MRPWRNPIPILLLVLLIAGCQNENTPPVAVVSVTPAIGDTTTVFLLEGDQSYDKETSVFALGYRWDINADGIWDTEHLDRSAYTARFSKPGYQKFILEVTDAGGSTGQVVDSIFITGVNQNTGSLTDSRDGRVYRTIQIGNTWWMAENLQFGKHLASGIFPANNGETEYLIYGDSIEYETYGGLYTWNEANEYPATSAFRDICPPGWRIPTKDQWQALIKEYPQPFDVLYYFGQSSIENLGVMMTGRYVYGTPDEPLKGEFVGRSRSVRFWTSSYSGSDSTRYFTSIHFSRDSAYFTQTVNKPEWIYHSRFPLLIIGHKSPEAGYVRCIKPLQ